MHGISSGQQSVGGGGEGGRDWGGPSSHLLYLRNLDRCRYGLKKDRRGWEGRGAKFSPNPLASLVLSHCMELPLTHLLSTVPVFRCGLVGVIVRSSRTWIERVEEVEEEEDDDEEEEGQAINQSFGRRPWKNSSEGGLAVQLAAL